MNQEFGVLYAATGERWIAEAVRSARSVREAMPDLPLAIFADDTSSCPGALFAHVFEIEAPQGSSRDKLHAMMNTPFTRTLFLDSDTVVLEPIGELAALLDRFDFAYAHAPVRYFEYDNPGVNAAFPMGNSGVVLYNDTEEVRSLLAEWDRKYKIETGARGLQGAVNQMMDQRAFRDAVFESPVNSTILPPEYNLRTVFPYFVGGAAPVKILHGRGPSLEKALRQVARSDEPQVGNYNRVGRRVIADACGTIAGEIRDWFKRKTGEGG